MHIHAHPCALECNVHTTHMHTHTDLSDWSMIDRHFTGHWQQTPRSHFLKPDPILPLLCWWSLPLPTRSLVPQILQDKSHACALGAGITVLWSPFPGWHSLWARALCAVLSQLWPCLTIPLCSPPCLCPLTHPPSRLSCQAPGRDSRGVRTSH